MDPPNAYLFLCRIQNLKKTCQNAGYQLVGYQENKARSMLQLTSYIYTGYQYSKHSKWGSKYSSTLCHGFLPYVQLKQLTTVSAAWWHHQHFLRSPSKQYSKVIKKANSLCDEGAVPSAWKHSGSRDGALYIEWLKHWPRKQSRAQGPRASYKDSE